MEPRKSPALTAGQRQRSQPKDVRKLELHLVAQRLRGPHHSTGWFQQPFHCISPLRLQPFFATDRGFKALDAAGANASVEMRTPFQPQSRFSRTRSNLDDQRIARFGFFDIEGPVRTLSPSRINLPVSSLPRESSSLVTTESPGRMSPRVHARRTSHNTCSASPPRSPRKDRGKQPKTADTFNHAGITLAPSASLERPVPSQHRCLMPP